jgi:SnoaL-like domain
VTATEPHGPEQRLADLMHREAIRDVLQRYSYGMDRRDQAVLGSVFWPDSVVHYGMFRGSGPEFAEFILPWFEDMRMTTTMHMLGNALIRINEPMAFAETYFQAFHCAPSASGTKRDVFVAGRYRDEFGYRGGEWRILERQLRFDWFRDFGDTGDWTTGTYGVTAATAHIGQANEAPWNEFRNRLVDTQPSG